jgi:DNA replication protein DnaC
MDRFAANAVSSVTKAGFLVIDDLGAEYSDSKGFFASLFDEVVNARYENMRPTILTTNLDVEGFAARYGERIVDRIREAGRFLNCGAQSLRRRAAP